MVQEINYFQNLKTYFNYKIESVIRVLSHARKSGAAFFVCDSIGFVSR